MSGLTMDVIMQGPIHDDTYDYAESYLIQPDVNQVVISTWDGERELPEYEKIKVIRSIDVVNPGQNNRNRQIYSTQVGIRHCTAPILVKTRTDQHIRGNSWLVMKDYFLKNYKIEEKFLDGTGPVGAIFTVGLYKKFVFHPQDHLFMAWAEDMKALFDLPFDSVYPKNMDNPGDNSGACSDWEKLDTRPNAYIGMHYYAKFDKRIQYMVKNYRDFIVDAAPCRDEALVLDAQYRDKIFKAFPKLDIWWCKYGCTYPYEWGVPFTEYHTED
jgi:hypothetical protein